MVFASIRLRPQICLTGLAWGVAASPFPAFAMAGRASGNQLEITRLTALPMSALGGRS